MFKAISIQRCHRNRDAEVDLTNEFRVKIFYFSSQFYYLLEDIHFYLSTISFIKHFPCILIRKILLIVIVYPEIKG